MTILPKKKQNKTSSNEDERDKDHPNERFNFGHLGGTSTGQNSQSNNSRTWSSRSEDKRSAPDSDSTDISNIGTSHSKRRHRIPRERDMNSDIQRSMMNSVRTLNKAALNSPNNSPRDLSSLTADNELAIPGSSGLKKRDENDIKHSAIHGSSSKREDNNEDISGYNSGDEYHKPSEHVSNIEWEEKERIFDRKIKKKGFTIKKMSEDGACLFRAVADQVYGDQDMHTAVRKLCMDYMEKNCDYFSHYVTENFPDYIQRKRCEHSHGNHIEIQALSELFNRPIEVYHYSNEPINIFQGCQQTDNEPIRLSYHRNCHYNSIVNPYKATIGVGLGLPSYKPGLAETSLVEKAMLISEQHELEQAMLEDKIRATDWEATNEAIEEQIARESYLQWLRENELRSRKKACATATLTKYSDEEGMSNSTSKCYSPRSSKSSPNERKSPKRTSTEISDSPVSRNPLMANIDETSSFMRELPASVFGLNNWDDGDILARVLAESQAEYIESLKRKNVSTSNSTAAVAANSTSQSENASTSTSNTSDYFSSLPSTSSNY